MNASTRKEEKHVSSLRGFLKDINKSYKEGVGANLGRWLVPIREVLQNGLWAYILISMCATSLPIHFIILLALAKTIISSLKGFFYFGTKGKPKKTSSSTTEKPKIDSFIGHFIGLVIFTCFIASSAFAFYSASVAISMKGSPISFLSPQVMLSIVTAFVLISLVKDYYAIFKTARDKPLTNSNSTNNAIELWISFLYYITIGWIVAIFNWATTPSQHLEKDPIITAKVTKTFPDNSEKAGERFQMVQIEIEGRQRLIIADVQALDYLVGDAKEKMKADQRLNISKSDINKNNRVITLTAKNIIDTPPTRSSSQRFHSFAKNLKKYILYTLYVASKILKILIATLPVIALGHYDSNLIIITSVASAIFVIAISSTIFIDDDTRKAPKSIKRLELANSKEVFTPTATPKPKSLKILATISTIGISMIALNELGNFLATISGFEIAGLSGNLGSTIFLIAFVTITSAISIFNCTASFLKFFRKTVDSLGAEEKCCTAAEASVKERLDKLTKSPTWDSKGGLIELYEWWRVGNEHIKTAEKAEKEPVQSEHSRGLDELHEWWREAREAARIRNTIIKDCVNCLIEKLIIMKSEEQATDATNAFNTPPQTQLTLQQSPLSLAGLAGLAATGFHPIALPSPDRPRIESSQSSMTTRDPTPTSPLQTSGELNEFPFLPNNTNQDRLRSMSANSPFMPIHIHKLTDQNNNNKKLRSESPIALSKA